MWSVDRELILDSHYTVLKLQGNRTLMLEIWWYGSCEMGLVDFYA